MTLRLIRLYTTIFDSIHIILRVITKIDSPLKILVDQIASEFGLG